MPRMVTEKGGEIIVSPIKNPEPHCGSHHMTESFVNICDMRNLKITILGVDRSSMAMTSATTSRLDGFLNNAAAHDSTQTCITGEA